MRVINDRDEKAESQEMGFFAVASHSFMCALGIFTAFFSPLPMIAAHLKLSDPWPKVAALTGAVLALGFLQLPLMMVLVLFIFGLFVSDGVWRETEFWKLILASSLVALVAGAGTFAVSAELNQVGLLAHWTDLIDKGVASLESAQKTLQMSSAINWEVLKNELLFEGPFLYLAAMLFSLWVSIGLAAHLGWMPEGHTYSGIKLRELRFPGWLSVVFGAAFVVNVFVANERIHHFSGGLVHIVGVLMFAQGCICLSELMSRKAARPRVRSFVYAFAVLLGFYAVVGIGVISPWALRKHRIMEEVI
jgi:hypothetical protein